MCFTFFTNSDAYITVIWARILKIVPQNGTLYLSAFFMKETTIKSIY